MASWSLMLILLTLMSHQEAKSAPKRKYNHDNWLRVYTLPIGQGSAHIIQCPGPTGEVTIFDMGSTTPDTGSHWGSRGIVGFLRERGMFDRIKNIVISHTHSDHINLLYRTLGGRKDLTSLTIYVSCDRGTFVEGSKELNNWINTILPKIKIMGFNNGDECNSWDQNKKCEKIRLCPGTKRQKLNSLDARPNDDFFGEVIFANKDCDKVSKAGNRQSLMMKIRHRSGPVTILLPGDMQPKESDGFTKQALSSTAYVLSHHGADNGNPDWFIDMVEPKVIFVSGDPYGRYGHPYCNVLDNFTNLCGTGDQEGDSQRDCPRTPIYAPPYTCTNARGSRKKRSTRTISNVEENTKAIYSTIYNNTRRHLLIFETDGVNWMSRYE